VGEDEDEAARLLERRRSRGMPDDGVWSGGIERFREMLAALEEADATWAVLVPAGPADRTKLLADALLAKQAEEPDRSNGGHP
jgi:hypothetical protein